MTHFNYRLSLFIALVAVPSAAAAEAYVFTAKPAAIDRSKEVRLLRLPLPA